MGTLRIEIDVGAANNPDALGWLDRILSKMEDGWHVWDTAREPDIEAFKDSTWICDQGRQGQRVREMLVRSVQREAWGSEPHARRVRVTMQPHGPAELIPEEAARLAEEPLVILVENRNSDGAFLDRVMIELDKPLHKYSKDWKKEEGPIRLDSVGGKGEMSNEVERRTRERRYRPRLVAVIDSDRKGPNDQASYDARKLQRTCKKWDVPCWVHAKREAENYLPRVLLVERQGADAEHIGRVEVWERLTDDQKNFFDMKHGIPRNPGAVEEELFDGLTPADKEVLSNGFGPNVGECWGVWSVQAEHELRARGQGDLEHGIALIRREV